MIYKAASQAILAVMEQLKSEVYEMERFGEKRRTVSTDLYLKVEETLLKASNYFEAMADNDKKDKEAS
ncbi:hypothetical protein HBA92_20840 [Ochrobactrum sp. MR28]|nr:hypothetical protein [Ochrobactrum sp. MR28]MBX8818747.1 hypothetical protein [Ochrobactrum sp. MR31]